MQFKFVFCSKRMKAIQTTKIIVVSSGKQTHLAHFFIGSKEIQKNLYLGDFFSLILSYYIKELCKPLLV